MELSRSALPDLEVLDSERHLSPADSSSRSGVQSVERAFLILETLAENDGIGLTKLAEESGLPTPTIHRLVSTLVNLGYVSREPSRQYILGPRLMKLGEGSQRALTVVVRPYLSELVERIGETANLSILDSLDMVLLAQVPSRHSMRMSSEVGRRVRPHCTAGGKAILATMPPDQVNALIERTGLPKMTERTLTEPDALWAELAVIRDRGYALDEGEREVGVRCVAVQVQDVPRPLAISISGPTERMTEDLVARAVPVLREVCQRFSADLS